MNTGSHLKKSRLHQVPSAKENEEEKAAAIISRGGVGVLPTDTLYGIVGSALKRKAVERIYRLRRRNRKKPMIILVSGLAELAQFTIKLHQSDNRVIKKIWPGKVSIVFPCTLKKFMYLHRGTKTLAIRFPNNKRLIALLKKTGPLVAPSANFEGEPPAKTVKEAEAYFGKHADFYIDGGRLISRPSTLIAIKNGNIAVLRKGAVRIK